MTNFQKLIKQYYNLLCEDKLQDQEKLKNFFINRIYIKFVNKEHIIQRLYDETRGDAGGKNPKMTCENYLSCVELFAQYYFILPSTKDFRYDQFHSYMISFSQYSNLKIPFTMSYNDNADKFYGQYSFTLKPGAVKPADYNNKKFIDTHVILQQENFLFDKEEDIGFDWNNYTEIIL